MCEAASFVSALRIGCPDRGDLPAMKALWTEAFEDDEAFRDRFYSEVFSATDSLIAKENGELVGMLHSVRYPFFGKGEVVWGRYLYGVATRRDFRGKGVFTALHERMKHLSRDDFFFLIPETDSLVSFYRRFGYQEAGMCRELASVPSATELSEQEAYACYLQEEKSCAVLHPLLDRDSFSLTVSGKKLFRSDSCGLLLLEKGRCFSFFLSGEPERATALSLPLNGGKAKPFLLPFLLN